MTTIDPRSTLGGGTGVNIFGIPTGGSGGSPLFGGMLGRNPLFTIGANLLANNTGERGLFGNIGHALMNARQQAQEQQRFEIAQQLAQARLAAMRQQMQIAKAEQDRERQEADQARIRRSNIRGLLAGTPEVTEPGSGQTLPGRAGLLSGPAAELAKLFPEPAAQALLKQALTPAEQAEQTAAMQNALFATGGDVDKARALLGQSLTQPGQSINIRNEGSIPQGMRAVRDDRGNIVRIEPIPGAVQPTAGERETEAKSALGLDIAGELVALMGSEEPPDTGLVANAKAFLGSKGVANLDAKEARLVTLTENLSNQMLAAIRGAQVGPAEQEKFERSMPRIGQSPELFKSNLVTTIENLKFLQQKREELRNTPGQSGASAVPEITVERIDAMAPQDLLSVDPRSLKSAEARARLVERLRALN